jgi:hypothetical protein
MLAARRLPEVLKSVLNDGVDGCCLMTEEGSILAAAFTEESHMIDTSLAAISSSIWNNISQGIYAYISGYIHLPILLKDSFLIGYL